MHAICMRATLNTDQKNNHYKVCRFILLYDQFHSIPGDTIIQFNVTGRGVSVASKTWNIQLTQPKLLMTPPKTVTLPEPNSKSTWKWMVGRLLSYWEGNFSGATLNFGGVTVTNVLPNMVRNTIYLPARLPLLLKHDLQLAKIEVCGGRLIPLLCSHHDEFPSICKSPSWMNVDM